MPEPSPSPVRVYGEPFDFQALPYDMQEYVLRFATVVGLCRCRSVSANMIVVYEGVMSTEFARFAGKGKPKFSRLADEFQFLYRLRRLDQPAQVTPILLWAAARDQHVLIKRVLSKSLGQPVRPGRRGSLLDEAMGLDEMPSGLGLGGGGVIAGDTLSSEPREDGVTQSGYNKREHPTMGLITMEKLRGPGGITPLHVACRNDHMAAIRELMKAGADVMACDNKQQTPFYHACALGAGPAANAVRTIVRHFDFLRKAHALRKTRDSVDSLAMSASLNSSMQASKSIDLNKTSTDGKTALYAAAERGHHGICRLLMIAGGHEAAKESVAMEEDRTLPVVASLDMEKGTSTASPLGIACANGKVKTASLLLSCGANVNGCGRDTGEWQTPIFLAAENGHSEVIEMLLEKCPPGTSSAPRHDGDRRSFAPPTDMTRCDLDFASKTGKTPLFIACEKGQAACARLLVEAGADVSKTTFLNKSPLYIACEMGIASIVQVLLRYSTREDVLMETSYGTSAAFIAQRNGFLRIKMQLTDFLTSTKKETKVTSFSRVEKARQKAYMSKLQTKYQKLEKLKAAKAEAVKAGKGGYLTKEDELKDMQQVERQLRKAKAQIEKATSLGAGGNVTSRAKTKKELRDAMPQGDVVRKWDGSAATGRGSEHVPGARASGQTSAGGKRSKKKSSIQTKRRGSAYEQTGNSSKRQRGSIRPKSKPEVPTQQPRGPNHRESNRNVARAQTHASNLKKYRDKPPTDDSDNDKAGDHGAPEELRRSQSLDMEVSRRSRHGWHGEGDFVSSSFEDNDFRNEEVLTDSDRGEMTENSNAFAEEEAVERELAAFTAQLDEVERDEEPNNVAKPRTKPSKNSEKPLEDARRLRAAAAAEAREMKAKQKGLREKAQKLKAVKSKDPAAESVPKRQKSVEIQKRSVHNGSTSQNEAGDPSKTAKKQSPAVVESEAKRSGPPSAPASNAHKYDKNATATASAAAAARRNGRKASGRYEKPVRQKDRSQALNESNDQYSDDDFEDPEDTPKSDLNRLKEIQPHEPPPQKSQLKKKTRPSRNSLTMARSQQVYGKMYSKAYQAAPSNSQKRAQSGRPTINTNGQVEVLELPPPQSPARTACKSPRGGWHHDQPENRKIESANISTDLSDVEDRGDSKEEWQTSKALTQAVFNCLQDRSLSSIHRCLLRFSRSTSGFLISPSLMSYVFGASQKDVEAVFSKLSGDVSATSRNHSESIDAFECFVATTLLASASLEDRLRFCFGLFDREGTNRLSSRHVGMLIRCCLTSVAKLHFIEEKARALSDLTAGRKITRMVEEVFSIKTSHPKKSKGGSDTVSAKQFAKWARGYRGGVPAPFVVGLLELQNAMSKS